MTRQDVSLAFVLLLLVIALWLSAIPKPEPGNTLCPATDLACIGGLK